MKRNQKVAENDSDKTTSDEKEIDTDDVSESELIFFKPSGHGGDIFDCKGPFKYLVTHGGGGKRRRVDVLSLTDPEKS